MSRKTSLAFAEDHTSESQQRRRMSRCGFMDHVYLLPRTFFFLPKDRRLSHTVPHSSVLILSQVWDSHEIRVLHFLYGRRTVLPRGDPQHGG